MQVHHRVLGSCFMIGKAKRHMLLHFSAVEYPSAFNLAALEKGFGCELLTVLFPPLLSTFRPRSKRKCWEVTDVLQRTKIYDAEAATRGAVNKLRAVADQGFAASALQSPPPSPPPCA